MRDNIPEEIYTEAQGIFNEAKNIAERIEKKLNGKFSVMPRFGELMKNPEETLGKMREFEQRLMLKLDSA